MIRGTFHSRKHHLRKIVRLLRHWRTSALAPIAAVLLVTLLLANAMAGTHLGLHPNSNAQAELLAGHGGPDPAFAPSESREYSPICEGTGNSVSYKLKTLPGWGQDHLWSVPIPEIAYLSTRIAFLPFSSRSISPVSTRPPPMFLAQA